MKRITQIFASILFVITVLTVYFAFDFTVNNAVARKTSSRKRISHVHPINHTGHVHVHSHDEVKTTKKRSVNSSNSQIFKRSNSTYKHYNEQQQQAKSKNSLNAKPGSFHKGRTGVKINKPEKRVKPQQKNSTSRITTTMINSFRKDKQARV